MPQRRHTGDQQLVDDRLVVEVGELLDSFCQHCLRGQPRHVVDSKASAL